MTEKDAAIIVAVLMTAYPNVQIGPRTSEVYEKHLRDLDVETAKTAINRLIGTSRFLPTIAEIRETEAEIRLGPKRLGSEAWGDVCDAIRRVGHYRAAPEFADATTAECVRLMDWRGLCLSENGAADRARFIELYDGLVDRVRADVVAGVPLPAPMKPGVLPWTPRKMMRLVAPLLPPVSADQLQKPPAEPLRELVRRPVSAEELDALLGSTR